MRIVFYFGVVVSVLLTLTGMFSDSAPKQAAAAALALCFVVIPYAVLRERQLSRQERLDAERQKALIADIRDMADRLVEAQQKAAAGNAA